MFLAQDARVINRLANEPEILPYVVPEDFDYDQELTFDHNFTPENSWRFRYFHNGEDDSDETASLAMLFQWSSPDVWELHMLALPSARGGEALAFATDAINEMFFMQGAKEIWGQTPVWNERARMMHHKVGGISRGFGYNQMFKCDVELFATSRSEWEAIHVPQ